MNKFYICAIIKDEHRYLAEWIEHHLSIGFDAIYLFEDFGSKSHADITSKYPQVHLTTCDDYFKVKRNYDIGVQRQLRLYNKFAYEHHGEGWCAFIDVDEFIRLKPEYTLQDIVQCDKKYKGVALFWKFLSNSGHYRRPESNLTESYTDGVDVPYYRSTAFKCIANLNEYLFNFHSVHCCGDAVNTLGKPVVFRKAAANYTLERAWIDHYFTKSLEDWMERFTLRGDLLPNHRKVWQFFSINQSNLNNKDELAKLQVYLDCNKHLCNLPDTHNKPIAVVGNKHDAKPAQIPSGTFVIMTNGCENREQVISDGMNLWLYCGNDKAFAKQLSNDEKLADYINSADTRLLAYPRRSADCILNTQDTFVDLWLPLFFDKVGYRWNYSCTFFTTTVLAICMAVYLNKSNEPIHVYGWDIDRKERNKYHKATNYEYQVMQYLVEHNYIVCEETEEK